MNSVHQEIFYQISALKAGTFVFPTEFRGIGTDEAVRQALSRLTKKGKLERLAHGIYFLPKIDPVFGKLYPSIEEVAKALAAHEHIRIRPAGVYALNKLGLSTQVPMKLVYITDGQARHIKIGKGGINFKRVAPKKFGMKGLISSLLILGLEEINIKQVTTDMEDRIKYLLYQETPNNLNHDLKLAPARINDFIVKLLKHPLNDRMA